MSLLKRSYPQSLIHDAARILRVRPEDLEHELSQDRASGLEPTADVSDALLEAIGRRQFVEDHPMLHYPKPDHPVRTLGPPEHWPR